MHAGGQGRSLDTSGPFYSDLIAARMYPVKRPNSNSFQA